jgi:glutaredoxin
LPGRPGGQDAPQYNRIDFSQHPRREQAAELMKLAGRRQAPQVRQMGKTPPRALFRQKRAEQIGGTNRRQQQQKQRAQKLS